MGESILTYAERLQSAHQADAAKTISQEYGKSPVDSILSDVKEITRREQDILIRQAALKVAKMQRACDAWAYQHDDVETGIAIEELADLLEKLGLLDD